MWGVGGWGGCYDVEDFGRYMWDGRAVILGEEFLVG